jgi:hypothetical protein
LGVTLEYVDLVMERRKRKVGQTFLSVCLLSFLPVIGETREKTVGDGRKDKDRQEGMSVLPVLLNPATLKSYTPAMAGACADLRHGQFLQAENSAYPS